MGSMRDLNPMYAFNFVVTIVTASAVFLVWVANRRRIATETIGRAEAQALRVIHDAERDAETRRKEAALEAKEKAHEITLEADRVTRERRREIAALEQSLADKTKTLAERILTADLLDKELADRGRRL